MAAESVRKLLKAEPFKPFQVVMSSGDRYAVRHPEMAMLTMTNLLVGAKPHRRTGLATDFHICALLHVATLEPIEEPEPAIANGG